MEKLLIFSFLCMKIEAAGNPKKYNECRKGEKEMEWEWIEKLNKTISYIEEHLTEEISYDSE